MVRKKPRVKGPKPDAFRSAVTEKLRQAISESGHSLCALERLSGVDSGRLSRFMRGERDLTLGAAEQIFDALGITTTWNRPVSGEGGTLAGGDTDVLPPS